MTEHMRRLGRFEIRQEIIRDHPDAARTCLNGLIVLRAELHLDRNCVEYLAIGPFHHVEVGAWAPDYIPVFKAVQIRDGLEQHVFAGWEEARYSRRAAA